MAPQYKLTYFDVKALAEPIRLMLAYKGVEFEDVRMTREEWPKHKPNTNEYPWGSLPVLVDGQHHIAQSNAIQRYLAKKLDLNGANDLEAAKADEIVEAMSDLKGQFFRANFESNEEKKKELFATLQGTTFPFFLGRFNEILKNNGTGFLVGNKVSYADLNIASYVEIIKDNTKGAIEPFEQLKEHQAKIFGLDGVKEWIAKRPKTQF